MIGKVEKQVILERDCSQENDFDYSLVGRFTLPSFFFE